MMRRLKRLLDVAGALALLVVASPLLAIAAILVRVTMGSPVLFRQTRTGLDGRLFTLVKLRTMRVEPATALGDDAQRLTTLGRWLRATSIDELPQLWNVLTGAMSLVGPRPLLPSYLERYSPEQARRHAMPPGITGLTQVSGRNGLSWEEKFALDVWYVDHWSLGLDLWVLWRTLVTVVRRDGIAADGHATMPEFLGNAAREGSR
jgi:lipopolysaccharide/colanic/teichoic acid biosynthesis glycosyltransferase